MVVSIFFSVVPIYPKTFILFGCVFGSYDRFWAKAPAPDVVEDTPIEEDDVSGSKCGVRFWAEGFGLWA